MPRAPELPDGHVLDDDGVERRRRGACGRRHSILELGDEPDDEEERARRVGVLDIGRFLTRIGRLQFEHSIDEDRVLRRSCDEGERRIGLMPEDVLVAHRVHAACSGPQRRASPREVS